MLNKITFLFFALLVHPCLAKTATVKAYGYQFSVLPTQTSLGETVYFTTYDGSSNYPRKDSSTGFVSNEFRPKATGSSVFRADYLSGTGYNIQEYGSISLNLSNTDSDGNSVPDWLQKENAVNLSLTGSNSLHWETPGWGSGNFAIDGQFTRQAGEGRGNYSLYYRSGGSTVSVSGNWYVRYFEGTLDYENGNFSLAIQSNDSEGIKYTVSGSSTYSSTSEDSLTLGKIPLSGAVGNITSKQSTLQRKGSVYSGLFELEDGEPDTSWVDYESWYFEIQDANDADNDQVPDLSDSSNTQKPVATEDESTSEQPNGESPGVTSGNSSSQTLSESGWNYHAWPWVFNHTLGDWLYYAHSSNGGMMVWSNFDKSWYFWNPISSSWEKS
jgi:hypothetical protein